MPEGLHRRSRAVQTYRQGRVSLHVTVPLVRILTPASHKRLTQQKKQRERERKELDALGRRRFANVRVVQRNLVYVVGIGPRFAKEEVRPRALPNLNS